MPHVRVRKSQDLVVALPAHLATALHVEEGGYLDAQEVEGGVLLKPLSPEERRAAALEGLRAVQARVKPAPEMARLSPEEQEEAIARMLAEDKAGP